eukprot:352542-Chlamydomonas_euryale.AAC.2
MLPALMGDDGDVSSSEEWRARRPGGLGGGGGLQHAPELWPQWGCCSLAAEQHAACHGLPTQDKNEGCLPADHAAGSKARQAQRKRVRGPGAVRGGGAFRAGSWRHRQAGTGGAWAVWAVPGWRGRTWALPDPAAFVFVHGTDAVAFARPSASSLTWLFSYYEQGADAGRGRWAGPQATWQSEEHVVRYG